MPTMADMKAWLCIPLIAASSMLAATTLAQDTSAEDIRKDPVESFRELAASFPKQSVRKTATFGEMPYDIEVTSYDVKKTDSLVSPIIGLINFSTIEQHEKYGTFGLDLQMVFGLQDGKWRFVKLLNAKNGNDFTDGPGGDEMMGAGQMLDFLKPYRDDQAQ